MKTLEISVTRLQRSTSARLAVLLALACTTGCPDDPISVDTVTAGSTGEDDPTTGPSTMTSPTSITTQGSTTDDPTTVGTTTTDTDSDTDSDTEADTDSDTDTDTGTDTEGGAICGDGVAEGDEACDGDDIATDCAGEGFESGDIACNDDCTVNTDACVLECGNAVIDDGEECDGDDLGEVADCVALDGTIYMGGALSCAKDCTYNVRLCEVITCGDDMVDGADTCDGTDLAGEDCVSQGFDEGTLACEAGCAAFDTTGCAYVCGDDGIDPGETCDGADLGGTDCVAQGFDGGTLACAVDCGTYDTAGCFSCGDDTVNGAEVCDGADLAGEDCVSQGFAGGGTLGCALDCGGYDTSMCVADFCGDGIINGDEVCDGAELGAADCTTEGFLGGTVSCNDDCTAVNTDSCFDAEATVCSTPALPVGPDFGTLTTDTLTVVTTGLAIVDVDVFTDITHTFAADLEMSVRYVAPDVTVELMNDQCGGDDDVLVTFDQDAAAGLDCLLPSPVGQGGNVLPEGDLDTALLGDGGGTWELNITDDAGGDGGTLNEWCVTTRTNSTAPFCGDGVIEGAEVCEGNEIGATTCEGLGFAGGSPDCGAGCDIDTSECSDTVIAVCNEPAAFITTGAPVNDTINIPITSGNVTDIDVHLDIAHTFTADLDITLTHNLTGTVVELTTDQCGGDNDIFAFFNDEADGLPDCVGIDLGIEGNVNAEGVLADFDAELAEGDWTLNVTDDAGGDDGTLNRWCVYITAETPVAL